MFCPRGISMENVFHGNSTLVETFPWNVFHGNSMEYKNRTCKTQDSRFLQAYPGNILGVASPCFPESTIMYMGPYGLFACRGAHWQ